MSQRWIQFCMLKSWTTSDFNESFFRAKVEMNPRELLTVISACCWRWVSFNEEWNIVLWVNAKMHIIFILKCSTWYVKDNTLYLLTKHFIFFAKWDVSPTRLTYFFSHNIWSISYTEPFRPEQERNSHWSSYNSPTCRIVFINLAQLTSLGLKQCKPSFMQATNPQLLRFHIH